MMQKKNHMKCTVYTYFSIFLHNWHLHLLVDLQDVVTDFAVEVGIIRVQHGQ